MISNQTKVNKKYLSSQTRLKHINEYTWHHIRLLMRVSLFDTLSHQQQLHPRCNTRLNPPNTAIQRHLQQQARVVP